MTGRILLINPNSNQGVTDGMSEAVEPLRLPGGPVIEAVTLASGPYGIESQADVEAVKLPLRDLVTARTDADAYVIGCFSDPGLEVCREATRRPVLGIMACAVTAALAEGDRFGVVALSASSVRRQSLAFRAMGVEARCAGSAPLGMSVAEAEAAAAYGAVRAAGERLVEDGADTILLGCAGMFRHRGPLAADLGVPVIDPTQAATAHALGLVLLARAAVRAAEAA